MKNQKLNFILLWVIAILLGIANSACSSKHKTTEVNKEEIIIENSENSEYSENSNLNVKVKTEVLVDDKTKTVTTKKTYTPIDATKPASVMDSNGQKKELNNASLTEETTTKHKDLKTKNSDNSEVFQKKKLKAKAKAKGKVKGKTDAKKVDLDKSGFNFWTWFWIIGVVIIGIVLVYLNYRFKYIKRVTAFFVK